MKYIRVKQPPLNCEEELQTQINILLANGLLMEAFNIQRVWTSESLSSRISAELPERIIRMFFDWAEKNHETSQLLCLPLNQLERFTLEKLLSNSKELGADSCATLLKQTIDLNEVKEQQSRIEHLRRQKQNQLKKVSDVNVTSTTSTTQEDGLRLFAPPAPVTKISRSRRSSIGVFSDFF